MFQMWKERRSEGGKTDGMRYSNVVAMGATLLDVARMTSIRWQQRRPGVTSSDVVAMGATILEVERETFWMWQ